MLFQQLGDGGIPFDVECLTRPFNRRHILGSFHGFADQRVQHPQNRTGSALAGSVLAWLTAGFMISRNGSANDTPAPFKNVRRGIRYEPCFIYPLKLI